MARCELIHAIMHSSIRNQVSRRPSVSLMSHFSISSGTYMLCWKNCISIYVLLSGIPKCNRFRLVRSSVMYSWQMAIILYLDLAWRGFYHDRSKKVNACIQHRFLQGNNPIILGVWVIRDPGFKWSLFTEKGKEKKRKEKKRNSPIIGKLGQFLTSLSRTW